MKAELALNAMVPAKERGVFSLRLILHGRAVCVARKPRCGDCVLADFCPSAGHRLTAGRIVRIVLVLARGVTLRHAGSHGCVK